MSLYRRDNINQNITEILVSLLDDNISGFRDIKWRSNSKRYNKLREYKTIKYELCVFVADAYYGHELKHRDDELYYSIHYERALKLLGKDYRKYLDLIFVCKGGAKISSWFNKDGSTFRWKLRKEIIDLCDIAYKRNKDVRSLVGRDGKVMTEWIDYAVSAYNEKAEFGKKVNGKLYKGLNPSIQLNKNNATLATHLFSDIYKYKTSRIKRKDLDKWLKIIDNIGINLDDDLRFGTDRLIDLHRNCIEIWNQLNIDIIGVGMIGQTYVRRNTGRLYGMGRGNVQNLQRELRKMLLSGLGYYDYDTKNAHFTLLSQYYKMLTNRELVMITKYVNNTASYREQISIDTGIRYDLVKKCLLGICYGAGISGSRHGKKGKMEYNDIYKTLHTQTNNHNETQILYDELTKHPIVLGIWNDVDKGYKIVKKSWKTRYKLTKTRMINMMGIETKTYHIDDYGKEKEKSKGKLLSHFLHGIETRILIDIIQAEGSSFILYLHDGWVSKYNWDLQELETYISQQTRRHLLEYSGIKDAFVIDMKKEELTEVVEGDWTKKLMVEGVVEDIM